MNQNQIAISDMQGKTVKHVFCDNCDQVLIVFLDNTFTLVYGYCVGDEATVEDGNFHIGDWWGHRVELLSLGIASQSQVDRVQAELDHRMRQSVEERRRDYERLKAEFESA